MPSGSLAGDSR
jgi:replicative DNA helicase